MFCAFNYDMLFKIIIFIFVSKCILNMVISSFRLSTCVFAQLAAHTQQMQFNQPTKVDAPVGQFTRMTYCISEFFLHFISIFQSEYRILKIVKIAVLFYFIC